MVATAAVRLARVSTARVRVQSLMQPLLRELQ